VNPCGVYATTVVLDEDFVEEESLSAIGAASSTSRSTSGAGTADGRDTNSSASPSSQPHLKRTHITFEGVASSVYLYINGIFIGYGEDSMTETEFEVTNFLLPPPHPNTIIAVVPKFSSGSYLECQ
ncbi:unnamed protein product, partial [Amoebophrya sp. A120]